MQIASFDKLCEEIEDNVLVLTPNARLALTLTKRYNATQVKTVWTSPHILPLSTWLKSLWRDAQFLSTEALPYLLSDLEESALWRQLIQSKRPHNYALDNLTQQIKSAWSHCLSWQITIDKTRFAYNDETLFFYQIAQSFIKATHDKQAASSLLTRVSELTTQNTLPPPKKVILAYFDELTPLQAHFFSVLNEKGATITHFDERIVSPQVSRASFIDKDTETHALIHWLEKKLDEGKKNIAVVVPDLEMRRPALARTLFSFLPKERVNFSMGRPLNTFGLVHNALCLLHLKETILSLPTLHLLLFTPYLNRHDTPRSLNASLYKKLKNTGEKHFSLNQVLILLKDTPFAHTVNSFKKIDIKGLHPPSYWCSQFKTCLEKLGFPGGDTLNSEEYQTLAKWHETLETFRRFDSHLRQINYKEALNWFEWLLSHTLFQAESKQEEIQVLGLLESLGLQFDAIWIMGLTEHTFPKQTNPSPFIPHYLQKQEEMPHSSVAREYQYAETVLNRLTQSAETVVLSTYQKDADQAIEPSSLIKHYPLVAPPIKSRPKLTPLDNYTADYKITPIKLKQSKGGTFLLKEQAQCPFRAYARFRLQLNEPRNATEGLDELDRGILIHEVLEYFWRDIKTQAAMLALSDDKRNTLLKKAIESALDTQVKKHPLTLTNAFKSLEIKRLTDILKRWLTLEAQRPPFEVAQLESKQTLRIGELEITMRADRIDTLASGEKMIIDYKTGSPSVSSWFQDRIDEPQLPLYALTDDSITALSFASLKSQDMKFKGLSESDIEIKGIKACRKIEDTSFNALREAWREKLSALVEEYSQGHIQPTPLSPSLCQQCDFKPLCGKNRDN